MLIRITGAVAGIKEYLERGQKAGREFTRDQLDERVVLAGDLEVVEALIEASPSKGDRYLHLTFSFREDYVPPELLQAVVDEARVFLGAAHHPDEFHLYAESHLPRIKSYVDGRTGKLVERLPHIHLVIPDLNLLTGKRLNLLGRVEHQEPWIDALQEHINHKFGFASPKLHRRSERVRISEVRARYKGDEFAGPFAELRGSLLDAMIERDITTRDAFEDLLREHGEVRERNSGKANACFNVRLAGERRGVNLKNYVFSNAFLTLSREEKMSVLAADVQRHHEEQAAARLAPKLIRERLQEWLDIRAKEVKLVNSGNRAFYTRYKAASREEKIAILADLEARFYARYSAGRGVAPAIDVIEDDIPLSDSGRQSARSAADDQGQVIEVRRPVDNELGQLQRNADERSQRRSREARAELDEIKRRLDASRLLATLAASHGVRPEKYQVRKGADGADRVACGSRHLNVTDFLTKEMHLPWATAERILREEHARQIRDVPKTNIPPAPHASHLWAEFVPWRASLPDRKAKAWGAQRAKEKQLRAEDAITFRLSKEAIYADGSFSAAKRKAALSLARMQKVQADKRLTGLFQQQRQELRQLYQIAPGELFRLWLHQCAAEGREDALRELRRQRVEPEAHAPLLGSVRAQQQHDGQGEDRFAAVGAPWSWSVARNGDVTYAKDGRVVLRDQPRAVAFYVPGDSEALETGLRLSLQKWGPKISAHGTDEFKRALVQTAVRAGLRVEFGDDWMQAYHVELLSDRQNSLPHEAAAPDVQGAMPPQPSDQDLQDDDYRPRP